MFESKEDLISFLKDLGYYKWFLKLETKEQQHEFLTLIYRYKWLCEINNHMDYLEYIIKIKQFTKIKKPTLEYVLHDTFAEFFDHRDMNLVYKHCIYEFLLQIPEYREIINS